jgi:hypothetical protein
LAQQAEGIHDDAGILNTILQTVDDHSPDANSASGGGNTDKLTPMSTGPFEAAEFGGQNLVVRIWWSEFGGQNLVVRRDCHLGDVTTNL